MSSFDTQHTDLIHDAQIDFYGKRLATASSDRTIKIFNVDTRTLITELRAHEGPVWQVAWAHPKYGSLLASCGYDRKVIIWKEGDAGWTVSYVYEGHELSTNSISWAPPDYGKLCLAVGSSDSNISLLTFQESTWAAEKIFAHKTGVNAVSWSDNEARFVSGGSDKQVIVWSLKSNKWEQERLSGHKGWVRDVAWAPNIGLVYNTIASCSQDGEIIFWRENQNSKQWSKVGSVKINEIVWRVSWSTTGNILAVTSGDNNVTLYTESLHKEGEWKAISQMDESGSLAFSGDQLA